MLTKIRTGIPAACRWLASNVLTAVVGLAVAAGVGVVIAFFSSDRAAPSPLDTQWEHERAAIKREGWQITTDRQVEMKGNTQVSTVLGLHRNAGGCSDITPPGNQVRSANRQPSDQVRIYDIEAGRLQQTFAYQPTGTGCHAWIFRIAKTADITGSGQLAVLGEFLGGYPEPGESIPVAISWSTHYHRYVVTPLITEPPNMLLEAKNAGGQGESFRREMQRIFLKPVRLTPKTHSAYGASQFRFALRGTEDSYLYGLYMLTSGVAAVGASGPTAPAPIVYQRALWHLEVFDDAFAAGWCDLSLHHATAIVADKVQPEALLNSFANRGAHWFNSCEAPLMSQWWAAHYGNKGS